MLTGLTNAIEVGPWEAIIAPFMIWGIGEIFWVGFFFPLVKMLRSRREKGKKVNRGWKSVWVMGIRRVKVYKWEIFFGTLGGIVIMDIYWMFINIAEEFFPSFLYIIVLSTSTFLLCTLLFSKGNGIMSKPPSSVTGSLKYIWSGFMNPFDKAEVSKMREVVLEVNEKIIESSSFC